MLDAIARKEDFDDLRGGDDLLFQVMTTHKWLGRRGADFNDIAPPIAIN